MSQKLHNTFEMRIWESAKKTEYVNALWDSTDDNMLRLFFWRKLYFLHQLNIECMKISHPDIYKDKKT